MLCFNFAINNYVGHNEEKITADGVGYYDYLPSIFIHNDIDRKSKFNNPEDYQRIKMIGAYVDFDGHLVNKYPVGSAILQSPFFLCTLMITDEKNLSGYEDAFQNSIVNAAMFYIFLTLLIFKLMLKSNCKRWLIHTLQILLVLATSLTHYSSDGAAYSHVYSLFVITLFLFLVQLYHKKKKGIYLIGICMLLGVVTIIRPTNILVVLFIPFMTNGTQRIKESLWSIKNNIRYLIYGLGAFVSLIFLQMYLWYLQTGSWIVYSYGEEGFNFSSPELFNVLFSYDKGLFVYTPVLGFTLLALIYLFVKKQFYTLITWVLPMFAVSYVISSWWCWNYGSSFGMRPYIEYYVIFFLLFAYVMDKLKLYVSLIFVVAASVFIPVNVIQTYQYRKYILLWEGMDKEKYWKVFLQTDATYEGWLWKNPLNIDKWFMLEDEVNLGSRIDTQGNEPVVVFERGCDEINKFQDVSVIVLNLEDSFKDSDKSVFIVEINDTINQVNLYWYRFYLGLLAESDRNQHQMGNLQMEISPVAAPNGKVLKVTYFDFPEGKSLKNAKLSFYSLAK